MYDIFSLFFAAHNFTINMPVVLWDMCYFNNLIHTSRAYNNLSVDYTYKILTRQLNVEGKLHGNGFSWYIGI